MNDTGGKDVHHWRIFKAGAYFTAYAPRDTLRLAADGSAVFLEEPVSAFALTHVRGLAYQGSYYVMASSPEVPGGLVFKRMAADTSDADEPAKPDEPVVPDKPVTPGSIPDHCLRAMYQPRHQGWYGPYPVS